MGSSSRASPVRRRLKVLLLPCRPEIAAFVGFDLYFERRNSEKERLRTRRRLVVQLHPPLPNLTKGEHGSVGRALPCQGRSRWFKSSWSLQIVMAFWSNISEFSGYGLAVGRSFSMEVTGVQIPLPATLITFKVYITRLEPVRLAKPLTGLFFLHYNNYIPRDTHCST